ncbi:alpha/beta fold hydrolase [Palleronia abyssalis]|uniref:2-(Acetamidomethylene)succinate hydrolase n=1 Tax=Palleronia abyssalis TaxID=1501240 RepID=A0A2R8C0V7_9RHOB|nr:alpha/beta hydrolase [Palleronia abyssalis]SPJ26030.1 2-(acetamidomethylene)succinate hydrolase [Palleronia abyssalis]
MRQAIVEDGATLIELTMDDGVVLRAETFGDPGAPGVLLAHGGGQTRYAWSRVARTLGENGWYAMALDLRGHGESDWDDKADYSLERYAADLVTVAGHFAGPPVVVGASLGGNAGTLAAGGADRQAFRALVLVDITPKIDEKGVDKILGFMGRHLEEGFASYEDAAEAISGYLPDRKARKSNVTSLSRYLREGPDGRLRWHWDPAFIMGRKSSRLDPKMVEKLNTSLGDIEVPLLLIRGMNSDLVTDESVAEFRRIAPHAALQDVSGAGHMIVGDRNDIFVRALEDFLAGLTEDDA